ncbi:MAG: hypothetical protein JSW60_05055 [Thermoplasmatales archaeon]|nr:MAG: hypothetical protein JSW60_05055 [Thermoplasmatales archaeon]
MKDKKFVQKDYAIAGVIEALLLVALVSIIISTIQLVYIPEIMEEREAEHMDEISNQFSTLKSMIELQAITNSSAPISTMISLGSKELPYFITARSYGEISTIGEGEYKIDTLPATPTFPSGIPLTSIRYEAYNSYFVDQIYVLEGGGIIVKQLNGESVMRVDPSIYVKNGTDIDIQFDLPIIVGTPGKNLTYGPGKCFVRTNWSQGGTDYIPNSNNINISTQYTNAWNESLYGMLGNNVNYEKGESYVKITKKVKDINLNLKYYYVYVQIGHGWIK